MTITTSNLKPYSAYKDSGVEWLGDIPAHWEVRRLKSVCSRYALYGANVTANSYSDSGVRFLRTTDITEDGKLKDLGVFIAEELVRDYLLTDGDILISRSGTIGRSFLYDMDKHGQCAYAGYLVRFIPDHGISPEFIFLFTKARSFTHFLRMQAISSTIDNVNGEKYANCPLPLPPLSEQRAIAAFLDRETAKIDALVGKKKRLIELLREKRIALISHAITKGLDPAAPLKDSGVEWLGDIPAHWEVRRLKYTAPLRVEKLDFKPQVATYIGLEHIESWTGQLFIQDQPENVESVVNQFESGDVLFGKLRPYLAKVARPEFDGVSTGEILALYPMKYSQIYLYYSLLNKVYIQWVDTFTYGTKMPRVSPDQVSNSFVPLPPLPEQRAIAAFLDRETAKIDALVTKVEEAIDRLQEYRTALISAAVTGKIDVREAAP